MTPTTVHRMMQTATEVASTQRPPPNNPHTVVGGDNPEIYFMRYLLMRHHNYITNPD